jgi:hypothetical protein
LTFELAGGQWTPRGGDAAELGRERELGETKQTVVFEKDSRDVGTAFRH